MALAASERNIATSIILSIVTCGIYGIVWFIQLTDEIRDASDDETIPSGGVAFLLSLVTCNIYGFYWAYRMGKGLQSAEDRIGMRSSADNSLVYLLLQIFGLAIVNFALMQNELNMISRKRREARHEAYEERRTQEEVKKEVEEAEIIDKEQ